MKRLILNIPIGNNASMHNHVSATIEASFWLLIASAVKLMALYHGKYSMTSAALRSLKLQTQVGAINSEHYNVYI